MFFAKQLRSFLLKFRFFGKCIISLAALPLIFILFATLAHSAEVGLQWDPNTEPELAGYKLYYGLESGNYTSSVDVGNQTSFTLIDIEYDTVYYFAVTAYDIYGEESDYSGEISYSVPLPDAVGSGDSPDVQPVDSDNDGISDTDEIDLYGTDPDNPDSDGDGVTDGAEISAGSDPTDPNSAQPVVSASTIYEDAEDGTTNGWDVYLDISDGTVGTQISNIFDNDRSSHVIQLTGAGTDHGYQLANDDLTGWRNSNQFIVEWSMNYSESFEVYIDIETTAGHRYLQYTPADNDYLGSGEYVRHGIGSDVIDGKWHTFVRDLQADLEEAQPGVTILEVNGFLIRGSGKVDDIKLHSEFPAVTDPVESFLTIYEDAEDGTTNGWDVYLDISDGTVGTQISNIFDNDRSSRVIELTGAGTDHGYQLANDDLTGWRNSNQFIVEWSMNYSESFEVYIDIETTAGHRYLQYTPADNDYLGSGEYVRHGIGSDVIDGKWHTFVRDLQADLEEAQPGVTILEVNGFLIRGSGKVDDIKLHSEFPAVTDPVESFLTIYEDAEDGTTNGWNIYDNTPRGATIANVYDDDRQSRIIQLTGSRASNGYCLRNDDGSKWQNSTQFLVEWSMNYSEYFEVYIDVETTAGHRYLYYTPDDDDYLGSGEYVRHGIGSDVIDGKWHTFVRDLQADLEEAQPGVTILEVNGFLIRGSGKVDDIKLGLK